MTPDELQQKLEAIADECADTRLLIMELFAHHLAMQTVMRQILSEHGHSKTMLDERLAAVMEKSRKTVQGQFGLWQKSSGAKPPLNLPPNLPDEEQNN